MSKITVLCLTTSSKLQLNDTVQKIKKSCEKFGVKFYPVLSNYAYIETTENSVKIYNTDGNGTDITIDPENTVCFVRGGVTNSSISLSMMTVLENAGVFLINDRKSMEICANKLETFIEMNDSDISTPRTAFVSDISSLDDSLNSIGNKFPVILKTLTGAEGVGVSIIQNYESLKSVLQTLWKYKAEVLIQEYLKIDNDVRTLILDGKIIAAAQRKKAPKDFRTNLAQGSEGGPYTLSDKEKQLVLSAANAVGCYYCGVDSVMTKDGKCYIIEINASPGSGNVYRSYFPDNEGNNLTGQDLIDRIVKYAIDKKNWAFTHTQAETFTSAPIEILDLGQFTSKVDTGNDSYNVLGAENITENNNLVTFKVNGKILTKPIVSHVLIRTNNKSVERRPVVEFDVRFKNRWITGVRFSLAPRYRNRYPVLLGMRFLKLLKLVVTTRENIKKPINPTPETQSNNLKLEQIYHKYLDENNVKINRLVNKMTTFKSLNEFVEMEQFLKNRLRIEKSNILEDALRCCESLKTIFKSNSYKRYIKESYMNNTDKQFNKFIGSLKTKKLSEDTINLIDTISEAGPWSKGSRPKGGTKITRKMADKLTKDKVDRDSKRGSSKKTKTSKSKSDGSSVTGPNAAAAKRFISYKSAKKGERKHPAPRPPEQDGKVKGKIDGDLKGRFERYYGKDAERIRFAVMRNISKGKKYMNLSGLAAGRRKGLRKKKKNVRENYFYEKVNDGYGIFVLEEGKSKDCAMKLATVKSPVMAQLYVDKKNKMSPPLEGTDDSVKRYRKMTPGQS